MSRLLAGATVIAIATSAGVLTAASPPAMGAPMMAAGLSVRAETSADARAAAEDLLRQVDDLQTQVDHATADYAGALQAAASAVSGHLRAEAASGVARRDAEDSRDRLDEHLRALYKSGGPTAVYASVLDADSIVEALDRVRSVERVVGTDRQVVTASEQAGGRAERGATDAAALAQRQVAVERQAGVAASRVQDLLDRQRPLLDQAVAHAAAVQAAEEEAARQRALRAAAAAAAARLRVEQDAAAQLVREQVAAAKPRYPAGVGAPGSAAAGQNGAAGVAGAGPVDYFALYHAAAPTCPGLSWTVLAAIGQVETGHGTDTSTSPAGAMGPMQFLPATFAMVAVDGDGDGRTDIQNPADAIFTAAHYLCGNGAGTGPAGLSTAIWNYNHADWYVALVLSLAAQYVG